MADRLGAYEALNTTLERAAGVNDGGTSEVLLVDAIERLAQCYAAEPGATAAMVARWLREREPVSPAVAAVAAGVALAQRAPARPAWPGPCTCECSSGGFCGGCGHAGCAGRR